MTGQDMAGFDWFGHFLVAVISGVIAGSALRKRPVIGETASNLALAAGIAGLVNSTVIAGGRGYANDMAGDWAELGQRVPALWTFAQTGLEVVSAVLHAAALMLLAAAVFAPRTIAADRS
jgi:hypothetical protein